MTDAERAQLLQIVQTSPPNTRQKVTIGDTQYFVQVPAQINSDTAFAMVGYGAGGVLDNLRNNWLWYFVFPVVVFLIVEIYFVIRNILELRNEKRGYATEPAKELSQDQLDLIRQQIKAELEAEAKKKEQENNSINQEDYSLEDQGEKKEDTQE